MLYVLGGASSSTKDLYGSTALHYAAERGRTNLVSILLNHDACSNEVNHDGWTPLHLAASCGNVAVAKVLMKDGAGKGFGGGVYRILTYYEKKKLHR